MPVSLDASSSPLAVDLHADPAPAIERAGATPVQADAPMSADATLAAAGASDADELLQAAFGSTGGCEDGSWFDDIVRVFELLQFLHEAAKQSPTLAKVIAQAERDGVEITVLSDCEYQERFPGTAGVTYSDGHVYVPESAVRNGGTGALEHELIHGILYKHGELFDPSIPLDQRIEAARELFEGMGLDPKDGERLVRASDYTGQNHHIQTRVTGVDIERERNGLPPLTPAQRDALYTAVAEREAALDLQRWIDDQINNKGRDPAEVYAEAERRWAATGVGADHPPVGATAEERRNALAATLIVLADEAKVKDFER